MSPFVTNSTACFVHICILYLNIPFNRYVDILRWDSILQFILPRSNIEMLRINCTTHRVTQSLLLLSIVGPVGLGQNNTRVLTFKGYPKAGLPIFPIFFIFVHRCSSYLQHPKRKIFIIFSEK
jgi:hypothetical protein